ncbi:unnamed protein product [Blepharisma stoltei]|uniref:Uncharacterized protein n=1 Tax=Blepharisma stoltei TaxID=1481888 RepID=A0AAU9I7W8_9CILI|nr:unnamed protein product [Blepharisma stoltei]
MEKIWEFIKHQLLSATKSVGKALFSAFTKILTICNSIYLFYSSGKKTGLMKWLEDRDLEFKSWISGNLYSRFDNLEKSLQDKEKILENHKNDLKDRCGKLNERIEKLNEIINRIEEIQQLQWNKTERKENYSQASYSVMEFSKLPLQDQTQFFKCLSNIDKVPAILSTAIYIVDFVGELFSLFSLLWSMWIGGGLLVLQMGIEVLLSYDDFNRKEKYLLDNLKAFDEYILKVNDEIKKCDSEISNINRNILQEINNAFPGVDETKFFEVSEKMISELKSRKPISEIEEEEKEKEEEKIKKSFIDCVVSRYKSGTISYEKMSIALKRRGISEDELKKIHNNN